jgi:hypothetical protein
MDQFQKQLIIRRFYLQQMGAFSLKAARRIMSLKMTNHSSKFQLRIVEVMIHFRRRDQFLQILMMLHLTVM